MAIDLMDAIMYKALNGGGGGANIEALSVTENGTYVAPSGVDGYSPVTVNVSGGVPSGTMTITLNGAYDVTSYAKVKVNVPGGETRIEEVEITDSWDEIISHIDAGDYGFYYNVGNYKPLNLGSEGVINMQIVAMDADQLSGDRGTAPLTFLGIELLKTTHSCDYWYPSRDTSMKTYLNTTILDLFPNNVKDRVQDVIKPFSYAGTQYKGIATKLWIPSVKEISDYADVDEPDVVRYNIYNSDSKRAKSRYLTITREDWWTRTSTADTATTHESYRVSRSGVIESFPTQYNMGVCLGFCLGRAQS